MHRYLSARIEDYQYQRHFGGVFYLFLRGMHPQLETGNGVFFNRPEQALVERLDQEIFACPENQA